MREECYQCNLYDYTCDGRTLRKKKKNGTCENKYSEPNNTPSKIQIRAFHALYKTKKLGGMPNDQAFVESIVQSSDIAYEKAKAKRPNLIQEYDYEHERNKIQTP